MVVDKEKWLEEYNQLAQDIKEQSKKVEKIKRETEEMQNSKN